MRRVPAGCSLGQIERYCYELRAVPREQQVRVMSRSEIEHLQRYRAMLESSVRESLLEQLPGGLRHFPAAAPDVHPARHGCAPPAAHVVARFTQDVPSLLIDPVSQAVEENVQRGDMYVVQYGMIADLLAAGRVELL